MKTTFGRQFLLTALLIFLCILSLALAFRGYMLHSFTESAYEPLENNVRGLARLASPYNNLSNLSSSWDMRINLYVSAGITGNGTKFLICTAPENPSREGLEVVMCSCSSFYCSHLGKRLYDDEDGYIAHAMEHLAEQDEEAEIVTDVFTDTTTLFSTLRAKNSQIPDKLPKKYLASIAPIHAFDADDTVFAYAVAYQSYDSIPIDKINDFIYVLSFAVFCLALLILPYLMRSQYQPLQDMAVAVRRFGHGELDVRIPVGGKNTEEIDELAVAFNNMAVSLEQSELRRREFVANISHELKTPMTTIAGFMDGMLDGTIPQEHYREYMQTVSKEVRRLSRLVRSMLEISRLQSQGIPDENKQIFDICEQAGQTLFNFEQKINDRGLHVTVDFPDHPLEVFAEKDSITQVIYNLIDNAVKFCNPDGELTLRIVLGTTKALISISNTGATIPEDELPRIFERFHKADKSRSSDRDGVGLGLYIVRTIILSHGEDITITSRDGLTTFTFTLALPA